MTSVKCFDLIRGVIQTAETNKHKWAGDENRAYQFISCIEAVIGPSDTENINHGVENELKTSVLRK